MDLEAFARETEQANHADASDLDTLIAHLCTLRDAHGGALKVLVCKDSSDSYHALDGAPTLNDRDAHLPPFIRLDIND